MTSKDTVLNEVSVLAKSRSEKGSQKLEDLTLKSHQEWVVLQEHSSCEIWAKVTSRVKVSP